MTGNDGNDAVVLGARIGGLSKSKNANEDELRRARADLAAYRLEIAIRFYAPRLFEDHKEKCAQMLLEAR
ncbi:MAG: hypothetical protein LLG14_16580 [Nocardiaceae bacterium]|nr:hypothetical protein [Nocardiaceae bacterium]